MNINMDTRKSTKIASDFCKWVLDEGGNPKQEFIDYVYEDDEFTEPFSIYLYVDYDEFYPENYVVDSEEYNEELFTFVELRGKAGDCIKSSRCLGTNIEDISKSICEVCY